MSRVRACGFVAFVGALTLCAFDAVPQAQLIDSLTVTLTSGGPVSFPLTRGSATNAGSVSIDARTAWSLVLLRNQIALDAYFTSSTSALTHQSSSNTVNIPSARVEVSLNGGPYQPFNQTVAFGAANAGRRLFTQPLTLLNLIGQRNDRLDLNINLSGYNLPADSYTGVLRLRARATV